MKHERTIPPKLANRFLKWFLRNDLYEEVQGDLQEQYYHNLKEKNLFIAKLNYWFQVFHYLRPFALRGVRIHYTSNYYGMYKNYFVAALRNLKNNKTFGAINIVGLSIGMAACFLIFQYIYFELSYDRFHKYTDDIYRVYLKIYKDGKLEVKSASVSPVVATSFHKEISAIKTYTRMVILGPDGVLTYKDHYISESNILLADTAFFDVFSFHLIHGNEKTAFSEPFCVVITESTARKLFDDIDPVGQQIIINAKNFDGTSFPFKVTGVIKDFPKNTHLHPGVLISYPTLFKFVGHRFDDSWTWNETYTYFRLNHNIDPKSVESEFPAIVSKYRQNKATNHSDQEYGLQAVKDIHLHSDLQHEVSINGKAYYVYLLMTVGLLILLIAYINFVNLVTVKAMQRAKEVSIRKVTGASRAQIIIQFIIESFSINSIALVLAIFLLWIGTPFILSQFNIILKFDLHDNPRLWIGITLFVVLLVSGSCFYPSMILSRYNPQSVLKGNFSKSKIGSSLRQSLVTVQFIMALMLIAFTLTAYLQVNYMQKQSLGFNPEKIVIIKGPKAFDYGYKNNITGFSHELSSVPDVLSVSASNVVPGQEIFKLNDHVTINGEETSGVFSALVVAPNYFSQYNIPLIAGRPFTDQSYDQNNWIINEFAMRLLGFKKAEDALGERLNNGEIIGIVKDYHQESLQTAIPPTLFNCGEVFNYYSVKLETGNLTNTLNKIKESYQQFFPGSPFNYFFLDDFFNQQYNAETQFNKLFGAFSGLAIVIAFLGLLGLSSYTNSLRIKEIGIRKVFGASINSMILLIVKDFFRLVFISALIGLPLSYFLIHNWLLNYPWRIGITWWMLLLPLIMILILVILTTSFQTIKTALTNPVESLRYE